MAIATEKVLFPWTPGYSVGIPQIDTQHKVLIQLINDLHAAMSAGHGKDALGKILDELVRYTEVHFTSEEGMLRQKRYSKLTEHHVVHQDLTRQVVELRDKYRANALALTVDVMYFLQRWLADHIMVHDQAYAKELREAGARG